MIKNFPNKKILRSKEFYLEYINHKNEALMNINFKELDKIINQIKITYKKKEQSILVVMEDHLL